MQISPKYRVLAWIALVTLAFFLFVGFPTTKDSNVTDKIPWRTDYAKALAEAAQAQKPVLLDFTASWCPPCQVMKRDVWSDEEVGRAVQAGFIPVLVDVDLPANAELGRRYSVSSIPRVLVVDAGGRVLRQADFMNKAEALSFLSKGGTR